MTETFFKWRSIENYRNFIREKHIYYSNKLIPPDPATLTHTFRGKVKLHGTNAAFTIFPDGTVTAQKRSSNISVGDDNFGFAAWVKKNIEPRISAFKMKSFVHPITFHGEWCGPGIQNGVACSAVKDKFFAIFSMDMHGETDCYHIEPKDISNMLEVLCGINGNHMVENLYVLPWETDLVMINIMNAESVNESIAIIDADVNRVAECDPFVKETFGIEGIGEGLVYYSITDFNMNRPISMFKAKSEKFSTEKQKSPASIDIVKVSKLSELADFVCTEARLNQGLFECFGNDKLDIRNISVYLKWVGNDVLKECENDIVASGYAWKEVAGHVTKKAASHFKKTMDSQDII